MWLKPLSIDAPRPYHLQTMPFQILATCVRCGACLPECPTDAIIEGLTQFHIDADTCLSDQGCVAVCPVDAIVQQPPRGSVA